MSRPEFQSHAEALSLDVGPNPVFVMICTVHCMCQTNAKIAAMQGFHVLTVFTNCVLNAMETF
jgi:hypothetical protein